MYTEETMLIVFLLLVLYLNRPTHDEIDEWFRQTYPAPS
jgi:hypothetical protein